MQTEILITCLVSNERFALYSCRMAYQMLLLDLEFTEDLSFRGRHKLELIVDKRHRRKKNGLSELPVLPREKRECHLVLMLTPANACMSNPPALKKFVLMVIV